MCAIVASITIHQDNTWKVFFHGREIPHTNFLLSRFPVQISSPDTVTTMIDVVNRANICPGNPEKKFVDFCQEKRGGEIRGERGLGPVVAFVDKTTVTGTQGETLNCSVRRTD